MEYKDLSLDYIKDTLSGIIREEPKDRNVRMYTNAFGVDQFEEALYNNIVPSYRIYIGKKVPRWITNNIKLHKSHYTNRWYKIVKL